jgi:hypothetical protein
MRRICNDEPPEHEWRDARAIKPLGDRLGGAKDYVRFEIIRLLRHLSNNCIGPEDYRQWSEQADGWVTRWRGWAAKS